MKKRQLFCGLTAALAISVLPTTTFASGDHHTSMAADGHAPIQVMGDHIHKTGEWMLSYRYMEMNMDGLQDGSDSFSGAELLANSSYMMAPTEMTMKMHMLGAMYAPSDNATLMLMLPYLENDMDMLMRMGPMMTMKRSMHSSGIGDIKLGALTNLYQQDNHRLHLNLIVSAPTGSIDEENSVGAALPYRMQLGSGTYDLLPGITYNSSADSWTWGAQASAVIRLGENDRGYTLGDRYKLLGWLQKSLHQKLSVSITLNYEDWDNIDGSDDELNPMMTPLADPDLQGGNLLTAAFGANLVLPGKNRLAFTYTTELEQDLDGPQMAFDNSFIIGWQLAF